MLKSIEGIYKHGKVELSEVPAGMPEQTRVIVTFLSPNRIDLHERGIDARQAAELRSRLSTFAEEWDSEEMAAYDDYDRNKT